MNPTALVQNPSKTLSTLVSPLSDTHRRKGSMSDLVTVAVTVFVFGISLLMAMKMHDGLVSNSQVFADSQAMDAVATSLGILDYGAVFLAVGLFVVSIVLATQIATNPVFFPISLLSLAISVFVSAQLANVYLVIADTNAFQAVANALPFTTKLLGNFPLVIGVGGFMIILALYAREGGGGSRAPR